MSHTVTVKLVLCAYRASIRDPAFIRTTDLDLGLYSRPSFWVLRYCHISHGDLCPCNTALTSSTCSTNRNCL